MQLHDRFPFFIEMQWYALDCYVATLAGSEGSSETAVDQGRLRKHVGRKKLKADDVADGDCKNRKMTSNDDDDDDADNADETEDNDGNDHSDAKLCRSVLVKC